MEDKYIYKEESYQITSALFEVHKQLGCGFLEKVYQEALAIEFNNRHIPFEKEKVFKITYKNTVLENVFIADFVCFNKIILELKAVQQIDSIHKAQVINYLRASNLQLGILANFGEEYLSPIRLFNKNYNNETSL